MCPQAFTLVHNQLMSHISKHLPALAGFSLILLGGCADETPTAVGGDLFPDGTLPVTVELTLPASAFTSGDTVYSGYTSRHDANFMVVADQFETVLSAHGLIEFVDFPDTVFATVDGDIHKDTVFTYGTATLRAVMDTTASTRGPAILQLWSVEQEWDAATATWELARNSDGEVEPWQEPGGTRGQLLAEAVWLPRDTITADTVLWQLDADEMTALVEDYPGLLVTTTTPGARVELGDFLLSANIHPASAPADTVEEQIPAGPMTFVVTPDQPMAPGVWSVGGPTSSRAVLTIDPALEIPTCPPAVDPDCPTIPFRDVTLNYAGLVLETEAVPDGYRPLDALFLTLRRLFEPEIGAQAPLGSVVAADTASPVLFVSGSEGTIELGITQPLRAILASDSAATLGLLAEPEGSNFGVAWFAREPMLRVIFTLPLESSFP